MFSLPHAGRSFRAVLVAAVLVAVTATAAPQLSAPDSDRAPQLVAQIHV
jgi:hypothetical protein